TGLVSVPLVLPSQSAPPQQPMAFAPQPYQPQQQSVDVIRPTQVLPIPPPPMPPQQVHPRQQIYHQQYHHPPAQQVAQYQLPPPQQPPLPSQQNVAQLVQPVVNNTNLVSPSSNRSTASNPIFLPGDSSRPLLSQGLFKIVPDAEDIQEETRNAVAAQIGDTTTTTSSHLLSVELSLGGDFLSSVIQYENQEQRFKALEDRENSLHVETGTSTPQERTVALSDGPAGEIQAYTQDSTYHDRSVGKSRNNRVVQGDKQEVDSGYDADVPAVQYQMQTPGVYTDVVVSSTADSPVVIVGSDIVFEPLPSAKAASLAAGTVAATTTAATTTTAPAAETSSVDKKNPSTSYEDASARPAAKRTATIGAVLPTMGTEEYLERTNDKEEWNGTQESSVAMGQSSDSNIIAPPPIAWSTKPKYKA
ncbi:hypothetical protein BGZ94_004138, partial [Podila epigama]